MALALTYRNSDYRIPENSNSWMLLPYNDPLQKVIMKGNRFDIGACTKIRSSRLLSQSCLIVSILERGSITGIIPFISTIKLLNQFSVTVSFLNCFWITAVG